MMAPQTDDGTSDPTTLAFAPIHKLALGVSVGLVAGFLIFALTLGHVALHPGHGGYLRLLDQYFYGYTVSPAGALVGLFWGFVTGFVGGWFLAFLRNLAIAVLIFAFRTKADLGETKDFLDHI